MWLLSESPSQGCVHWWKRANSVESVAFLDNWWKLTEASHETSILRSVRKKTRRKTSILKLRSVKVAVPIGKVAKTLLFRRCANVVLRGRHGTLWHSTSVGCKTVVWLRLPCLWEKSQKRFCFDVSQDVLMSFCVAGVALCDIPRVYAARLSCGWSCRAYGKSRKNVSFSIFFDVSQDVLMSFCVAGMALFDIPRAYAARLSSGWSCRAYGKSRKNVSFSIFFDVSQDLISSVFVAGVALCDIPRVWGARLSWS